MPVELCQWARSKLIGGCQYLTIIQREFIIGEVDCIFSLTVRRNLLTCSLCASSCVKHSTPKCSSQKNSWRSHIYIVIILQTIWWQLQIIEDIPFKVSWKIANILMQILLKRCLHLFTRHKILGEGFIFLGPSGAERTPPNWRFKTRNHHVWWARATQIGRWVLNHLWKSHLDFYTIIIHWLFLASFYVLLLWLFCNVFYIPHHILFCWLHPLLQLIDLHLVHLSACLFYP